MKVLVVGSGAREHAIIWRLSKDNNVDEIICLGENAGVSEIAKTIVVDIEDISKETKENISSLVERMQAFGYTVETLQFMLLPIVKELRDPLGSMGNDAALACLSDKPRMIYDYFKQLFAQVTNPAIDSIREEVIMSLECLIGPEGNLLSTKSSNLHRLRLRSPILSNQELMGKKELSLIHIRRCPRSYACRSRRSP